ncbi:dephospho-CoA kinase [Spiribacter salinus]|uniref:dephospho-CoA kinase n=1 Tax=Spiribacter salinus TaxID=1335746 RepID=UPI001C96F8C0|nr:dephospho-CoA kinase [Spiribacter salinus]
MTDPSAHQPLVIALTGGIAAGKTQVSDRFAARGVPVIDTDQLAREVIAPGTEGLAAVRSTFGEAIMNADGTVNRQALSERIFADADARRKLEAITHPRIRARVSAALRELEAPYALVVIPLLAETGWQDLADRVLVVDAPASLQRARLMQREQIDADQAARRLASQASREQRLAIADEVIDNTATPEALDDAVSALDRQYRAIADKNR